MNKKNYLWWVLGLVVVILVVYLLASYFTPGSNNPTPAADNQTNGINSPANNAAVGVPSTVAPTTGTLAPNTPPARTAQPIKAEFMTTKEKEALKIDAAKKVQVLQRLDDGTVGAYKIINNDSEIQTSF